MAHRRNLFTGKKGKAKSLPFWRYGKGPQRQQKKGKRGEEEVEYRDPFSAPDAKNVVKTRLEEDYRFEENKAYTYPPYAISLALVFLILILLFLFW